MATPPVFPHKGEALAMLDEEFARVDLPTPAGLHIEKQKRPGSQKLAWWHGDPDAIDAVETLASLAWLRTWLRITGGRALPAGGLRLHKDRVWLDRAIIGRLERDGILAFEPTGHFEPSFVLTDQGREWLAATGDV
ncbi:hypothetical protein [Novosphingobium sp. JCM 18896]|uniref:hypothetical protein n=1 Tax=Novosphingobium sp. JCM 18896 TaxID=2989731 RepID=UPI002223B015|nr:hypothetical protein [Novosphingobium sp. JCM 18896]MCW1430987.1 hypothetical protein [Novosphingobium sp. JCM 18896]